MSKLFQFDAITKIDLGGTFRNGGSEMVLCPIHETVKSVLVEMLKDTRKEMNELSSIPDEFEPASKYSGKEHLAADLEQDYLNELKQIVESPSIKFRQHLFKNPENLIWYFARFTDSSSNVCFAIRRATYFKGAAKENRMLALTGDDALRLVEERLFRLDTTFDFLVYDNEARILSPGNFVYICDLDRLLQLSVQDQAAAIEAEIPFLNLSTAAERGKEKKRTAQLFACVRRRKDLGRVSKTLFQSACKKANVQLVEDENGRLMPSSGSEENFLRILDRRRFWIEIIENEPECYNTDSRKLDKQAV